jgi:2-oxoglutarate ferredoxin oxidoreductase subunit alpha
MQKTHKANTDISLIIGGSAGQGLQTIESVISTAFRRVGMSVFSTSEYMSRVRGGSNSVCIRVSETPRYAVRRYADIAISLDGASYRHLSSRLNEHSIVIANTGCESLPKPEMGNPIFVPIEKAAEEAGGKILTNTVVAGIVLAMFRLDDADFLRDMKRVFGRKGEKIVAQNLDAARRGREIGESIREKMSINGIISQKQTQNEGLFLDGSHAIALGAVAGGCDFIPSYPMSPSTGVLTAMAEYSKDLTIAVEQVEDEITAANMAVGAWFAGARALVTTSGGGLALMAETVSLSGMTENPLVIHLAQRPGPATGLPTRTEQGDLNFALHIGHGEFARALFSPGDAEECFVCMRQAFEIADKFQVPAVVLTDQYLLDSKWEARGNTIIFGEQPQKYFVETESSYRRYEYTSDGLSPRGIPGFGEGLVCADSDEHNESGHIIEDGETREAMMEKRMHRVELIREEAIPVVYDGPEKPAFLVVGWGSTKGTIAEVLNRIGNKHIARLHIPQIFPVSDEIADRLTGAKKVIVVENNFSGQAADLLEKHTGRRADFRIVKYDGRPFFVEELQREITEIVA